MADQSLLTLFCLIEGDGSSFKVEVYPSADIGNLKTLIYKRHQNRLRHIDAAGLVLWKVRHRH
jgi:hypothetical protein